jgi:hypothetical protein
MDRMLADTLALYGLGPRNPSPSRGEDGTPVQTGMMGNRIDQEDG